MLFFALALCLTSFSFGAELQTRERGGCLIVYLRAPQPGDAFEANCDHIPALKFKSGKSFQELYSWVPPFLAYAFEQAERATCGNINCATDRSHVTVFVVANGTPNAGVIGAPGHMYLFVNTGFIDFTDAAARSYLADAKAAVTHQQQTNGYKDWMSGMRASGGRQCDWQFQAPTPVVAEQDFGQVQAVAQATYQVMFGHELAHYRAKPFGACGNKPAGLEREMACDEQSVNALLRANDTTMMPMGLVATLMALNSYTKIAGPTALGFFGSTEEANELQEQMNAMSWQTRAVQVVDLWDRFCRSGAKSKLCPDGFDDMIELSRALTESTPPKACTP